MGQSLAHINMKMFVVLALVAVAVAEPEAKPEAQFYGGAYYNYGASPLTTTFNRVVSPYSAYPLTYGPPRAHYYSKREADPALVYSSYVSSPLAATTPCGPSGCYHSPVVKYVANPMVKTVAAPVVATPFAPAVASHTITSYNSPTHYTAVSNGVFGPSYVAKNGVVQHVVKREAEADPALVYNNVVSPFTSTYSVGPLSTTFNHVVSPYHHLPVAATPLATNGAHAVAATTAGWTHSSNVGVCTNVHGLQVPC